MNYFGEDYDVYDNELCEYSNNVNDDQDYSDPEDDLTQADYDYYYELIKDRFVNSENDGYDDCGVAMLTSCTSPSVENNSYESNCTNDLDEEEAILWEMT